MLNYSEASGLHQDQCEWQTAGEPCYITVYVRRMDEVLYFNYMSTLPSGELSHTNPCGHVVKL